MYALIRSGQPSQAAAEDRESWQAAPDPETLFRAPWLRKRLRGIAGALVRTEEGRLLLALPYDSGRAFPLPTLFCLADIRSINGRMYAVFAFDGEAHPVFP